MQDYDQDNQPDDSQWRSVSRGSNRSDLSNNTSEDRENGRIHSASPGRESESRNSSISSIPDAGNVEKNRNDGMNMSHEDLSDVSDLESAVASPVNNDKNDVRLNQELGNSFQYFENCEEKLRKIFGNSFSGKPRR